MSTAVPPEPSPVSAAAQIRLRMARAQVDEVRGTDLAAADPATMMLMLDRLATTLDGLLELVDELRASHPPAD